VKFHLDAMTSAAIRAGCPAETAEDLARHAMQAWHLYVLETCAKRGLSDAIAAALYECASEEIRELSEAVADAGRQRKAVADLADWALATRNPEQWRQILGSIAGNEARERAAVIEGKGFRIAPARPEAAGTGAE